MTGSHRPPSGNKNRPDVPTKAPLDVETAEPAELYINRELSLLQFQGRVLEEAMAPTTPLLERVKFLGILSSNLDEMVMVRLAGLVAQRRAGVAKTSLDGRSASEQLVLVRKEINALQKLARKH